tara:strand:+ start:1410 stop:1679 length:270 start_codon:yes stop_codon:yes gene_type:complete
MAVLFRADDTQEIVTPAEGESFTLDELQGFVDGYIEPVQVPTRHISTGFVFIVNEEGRLKGLPLNRLVSSFTGTVIVGDVLLMSDKEWM